MSENKTETGAERYENIARDDVTEDDQVRVTYESNRSDSMQKKTGTVTSILRRGTGGIRNFKVDTGEEYEDGTPKIITVNVSRGGGVVHSEGRVQRTQIGSGARVERHVQQAGEGETRDQESEDTATERYRENQRVAPDGGEREEMDPSEVLDAITDQDQGDYVLITTEHPEDGEREFHATITELFFDQADPTATFDSSELDLGLELDPVHVESGAVPEQTAMVWSTWSGDREDPFTLTVWDPEIGEDGQVEDDYTSAGEVIHVRGATEDTEDTDVDSDGADASVSASEEKDGGDTNQDPSRGADGRVADRGRDNTEVRPDGGAVLDDTGLDPAEFAAVIGVEYEFGPEVTDRGATHHGVDASTAAELAAKLEHVRKVENLSEGADDVLKAFRKSLYRAADLGGAFDDADADQDGGQNE